MKPGKCRCKCLYGHDAMDPLIVLARSGWKEAIGRHVQQQPALQKCKIYFFFLGRLNQLGKHFSFLFSNRASVSDRVCDGKWNNRMLMHRLGLNQIKLNTNGNADGVRPSPEPDPVHIPPPPAARLACKCLKCIN